MVLGTGRRLDLRRGSQRCSKLSYLKEDHQAQVRSDQMVLVIIRQETGSPEWQPKTLKESWKTTPDSKGTLPSIATA